MMSEIAKRRVQLLIDECKDWILHAWKLKSNTIEPSDMLSIKNVYSRYSNLN